METDKSVPYVGVTGIATEKDAIVATRAFKAYGFFNSQIRRPMFGFLVSDDWMANRTVNSKYPSRSEINDLLAITHPVGDNYAHIYTKSRGDLFHQFSRIIQQGIIDPKLLDGVQLNVPWAAPQTFELFKNWNPNVETVMQLGPEVFRVDEPEDVAMKLARYPKDLVNRILFDNSGGKGRLLDLTLIKRYYQQVKETRPDISMVFAGGLSADNVEETIKAISLMTGDYNFSIDVENGIRNLASGRGGVMDPQKATDYVRRAARGFGFS